MPTYPLPISANAANLPVELDASILVPQISETNITAFAQVDFGGP